MAELEDWKRPVDPNERPQYAYRPMKPYTLDEVVAEFGCDGETCSGNHGSAGAAYAFDHIGGRIRIEAGWPGSREGGTEWTGSLATYRRLRASVQPGGRETRQMSLNLDHLM